MKIYLLDDLYAKEPNASYKAKIDVNNVFLSKIENSEVFSFYRYIIPMFGQKNRLLSFIRLRLLLFLNQLNFLKLLRKVKPGDVIVMPFPFEFQWFVKLSTYIYRQVARLKEKNKIKFIYIIHDLNCIRYPELFNEDSEVPLLELADVIIAHNPTMINWLISRNISKDKLLNLQIFDYLSPSPKPYSYEKVQEKVDRKVIYAGNLSPWKSAFIYKWRPSYSVELYGVGLETSEINDSLSYKGVFNPDFPIMDSQNISFGLVWDGSSCEELLGPGAYLRYNNPHKVSLYLSQEIPVIVWSEAALSSFVIDNNLGFAINKISDIDEIINNMSLEDYLLIKKNVNKAGKELREGGFMCTALKKALELVK